MGRGGGGELNRPREKKGKNERKLGREVPSPFPSLVAACIFPRQIFARALLSSRMEQASKVVTAIILIDIA